MVENYEVKFSLHANHSLDGIIFYLKENVSVEVAKRVYLALISEARRLEKMPSSRPIEHSISDENTIYRFAKKWDYKIVFFINEEDKQVEVIDVFHSRRNPLTLQDIIK